MKKRLVALALAMTMVFSTLTGCGSNEFDGSQIVAEVGEEKITAAVANYYTRYQQAQYETYYASYLGENMWETQAEAGVTYEENVKASIMESLHSLYVTKLHAEEYGVKLTEDEIAKIEKAAEAFGETNGAEAIEAVSGDKETVAEVLTLITLSNKMYPEMTKDVDRKVSDKEAAQKSMEYVWFTYKTTNEENTAVDMTDDEKAAQKSKAEAFAKKAKTGDFKALAEAEELEIVTKTFDATSTIPTEAVIAAADALKAGEVSDVIDGEDGCYVVKLVSELDEDATEAKKDEIIYTREEEAYNALVEKWMEETAIKVNEDVWSTIDFKKLGITIKDTTTEE